MAEILCKDGFALAGTNGFLRIMFSPLSGAPNYRGINFKVDTGADKSVLHPSVLKDCGFPSIDDNVIEFKEMKAANCGIIYANSYPVSVLMPFEHKNKNEVFILWVSDDLPEGLSLMGKDLLRKFHLGLYFDLEHVGLFNRDRVEKIL